MAARFNPMLIYLKQFALTHVAWLAILVIGVIAFHSWQVEHDQRILATQQVKASEARITDLQAQIVATNAAAAKQVQVVTKIIHDVQTPTQAVTAIPQLTTTPLNPVLAANPTQVSVDALPLVQVLGQCKTDQIALAACTANEKVDQAIITEKQTEITALKKPKGFWKRVGGTLKAVGIGIGIGAALGARI